MCRKTRSQAGCVHSGPVGPKTDKRGAFFSKFALPVGSYSGWRGGNNMQYFLKIEGVTGNVTDKLHAGWFTVDSFDISAMTPFSSTGGSPTGPTRFSPL